MKTVCTLAIAAIIAGSADASVLTYDPALGTLPTAQGWTFEGSFNAAMTVAGGTLTYGPTSFSGTTFWGHSPADSIDFSSQTVSVSATIRLTGAGFGNVSGFRRGGFSLYLEDDFGRWIIADLGDNNISLGNDNNRTSDPVAAFDLTSAFRTVTLEAGPTGSRLLVDGVQQLTLALGGGAAGGAQVNWGESTILSSASETQVRNVTFIPTPGAIALSGLGVLAVARRRRA